MKFIDEPFLKHILKREWRSKCNVHLAESLFQTGSKVVKSKKMLYTYAMRIWKRIRTQGVKAWYDGYSFSMAASVYSPRSVVNSMLFGKIENYWNQTETFEALQVYIDMNFDGLKDDVLSMIAGERIPVNTGSFTNDMTTFRTEDDVLTLLIHLGYLAYDSENKVVKIPNNEVRNEYVNSVAASDWGGGINCAEAIC